MCYITAEQWLDQTINFQPLAVYMESGSLRTVQQAQHPIKTAQLLREFDSVFDAVELTHLTPPQTPPESPPIADYSDDLKQVSTQIECKLKYSPIDRLR